MKLNLFFHLILLASVAGVTTSCQKKNSASTSPSEDTKSPPTIELLSHSKGKFEVAESVTLDDQQKGFALGGVSFTIKNRWADAEVKHETINNNPRESHAVELSWSVDGKPEGTTWIFPIAEANTSPALKGTMVQSRLLPPGTRMASPDEMKSSLLRGVQMQWQKKRYDLPEVGKEIFPGWKLAKVNIYQHALLQDDGTVKESGDTGFVNRVVELIVEAKDGSKERHFCFIDHPKLTAGIHPTILPVKRISGELASLSRLVVCESLKAPVEKSLLVMSPHTQGDGVRVWLWKKGEVKPTSMDVTEFPCSLDFGAEKVVLQKHWTKARRQIKWQERKGRDPKDQQPAILIETGGHFHAKSFVLIQGKPTPCKIMDKMLILKYKGRP